VSRLVAGFLGSPSINLVPARLAGDAEGAFIVLDTGERLRIPAGRRPSVGGERDILLGVRPEHFSRAPESALRPGSVRIKAVVNLIQPTGTRTYVTTSVGGSPVTIELQSRDVQQYGEAIDLALDLNRAILIDPSTDKVIT
jgi:multiple sugar transport system ATP-binding protein